MASHSSYTGGDVLLSPSLGRKRKWLVTALWAGITLQVCTVVKTCTHHVQRTFNKHKKKSLMMILELKTNFLTLSSECSDTDFQ